MKCIISLFLGPRGSARPLLVMSALCLLCAPLAGCPSSQVQQTTADLLIIAGNSTVAYCASTGNQACVTGANKFAALVSADVANFAPGTKSQNAIQIIQDFEGVIAAADPGGKLALLDLALSTAVSAIQVIETNSGATAPAATPLVQARIANASPSATSNPPQSVKEYKARWNAELKANPVPGMAPLK